MCPATQNRTFVYLELVNQLRYWYNKRLGHALESVRERISKPKQIWNNLERVV